MKKILISLFVLVAFLIGFADPLTTYTDAIAEWDYRLRDTVTTAFDTLSDDDDTTVLFSNFKPERGWEYVLCNNALTGGSADSVKVRILIRSEDFSGRAICSTLVDSTAVATGACYLIPFGTRVFGNQYDVLLQNYTDSGNELIINRWYFFRRRPIQYRRLWK